MSLRIKLFLSFILLSLLVVFISSTKIVFASNLFEDNFESGNLSKWQIIDGVWQITTDSINNHWAENTSLNSDNEIQAGDVSWKNYLFSVDIHQIQGSDSNLFFRVTGQRSTGLAWAGHNLPVSYGLHISGNLVELQKWTETGGYYNPPLASHSNIGAINNLKIQLPGQLLKYMSIIQLNHQ